MTRFYPNLADSFAAALAKEKKAELVTGSPGSRRWTRKSESTG
jgi:hypothetical protein